MSIDDHYLRLALEAAILAYDDCGRVGAVITRGGQVVAVAGSDIRDRTHAERNAIALAGWLDDPVRKRNATLYVTLQPCLRRSDPSNPSCSSYIAGSGIVRVVYGAKDPLQDGSVEFLRQAGVSVEQTQNESLRRACEEIFSLTYRPGTFPRS